MNLEVAILGAPALAVSPIEMSPATIAAKENALASSALIGKVTNRAQNDSAVEAMRQLKGISNAVERRRKQITEPFVEFQRAIKRTSDEFREDLDREAGRLELLIKDFVLVERRRIEAEQEAQRRELERIERERQEELKRIADEQARVEREAHEAQEAAQHAAQEAASAQQREAAQVALAAAEKQRLAAEATAQQAAQQSQTINDAADHKAYIESKPVEITRATGQITRKVWKISRIEDFPLLKARPDLVRKIEWDRMAITEALNAGQKLPGVTAEEDIKIGTRGRGGKLIDV